MANKFVLSLGVDTIDIIAILIPIFSIFIIGFVVGKLKKIDINSLSFIALNVFYPFLVFHTFYSNTFTVELLYVFIVITLLIFSTYILILILTKLLKYDKKRRHAMLLAGVFLNGGNFAVPVVLFTLGNEGFVYAVMIMIILSVYTNTIGLYTAASGAEEGISRKIAFIQTIKMPIIPAIVLGCIFRFLEIELPTSVEDTISFMANAAIPLIMVVLGIQLSTIEVSKIEYKPVGLLVFIRLILSPIMVIGINHLLGLNGTLLASVLIIVAAMPTAANATMFSVNYNVEPELVSSTTLLSTLLSLLTLSFWLSLV